MQQTHLESGAPAFASVFQKFAWANQSTASTSHLALTSERFRFEQVGGVTRGALMPGEFQLPVGQNARLGEIKWTLSTSSLAYASFGHKFHYSARGQRDLDASRGIAFWGYHYNARGELDGAGRRLSAAAAPGDPGRDFGYGYDDIGNRVKAVESKFTLSGSTATGTALYDKGVYAANLNNQVNSGESGSVVIGLLPKSGVED